MLLNRFYFYMYIGLVFSKLIRNITLFNSFRYVTQNCSKFKVHFKKYENNFKYKVDKNNCNTYNLNQFTKVFKYALKNKLVYMKKIDCTIYF